MPDELISDLTPNPSITGAEEMPTERGGANYKNTFTAFKTWLGISGTNTGDETTSSIQTKRPIKTVNGSSLEGSGDVTTPDTTYSDAEIKTKYEANTNTNAYTDSEQTVVGNTSNTNTGDQDLSSLSNKATTQTTVSATTKTVASTDSDTSFNLYGAGALSVWTVNVGSLTIGEGFEVNIGDADGVSFVAGAGANVFGVISGSTTVGDSVFIRRLADGIFGLTGEVYKVY